ncbi:hypothetical protein TELCIR_07736, partial [Teladorsagia circumcincta]
NLPSDPGKIYTIHHLDSAHEIHAVAVTVAEKFQIDLDSIIVSPEQEPETSKEQESLHLASLHEEKSESESAKRCYPSQTKMLDIVITKKRQEGAKAEFLAVQPDRPPPAYVDVESGGIRVGGLTKRSLAEESYKTALEPPPEKTKTWPTASDLSTMIERTTRSVPSKTATTDDKMSTARDSTDKSFISSTSTAAAPTVAAIPLATTQASKQSATAAPTTMEPIVQSRQDPTTPATSATTPASRTLQRSDITISGQSSVATKVRSSKTDTGADIAGGPVSVSAMRQKSTLKTPSIATKTQATSGLTTTKAAPKTRTAAKSRTRKKKSQSISSRSLGSQPASNTSSGTMKPSKSGNEGKERCGGGRNFTAEHFWCDMLSH